jgi:hypothetical protein
MEIQPYMASPEKGTAKAGPIAVHPASIHTPGLIVPNLLVRTIDVGVLAVEMKAITATACVQRGSQSAESAGGQVILSQLRPPCQLSVAIFVFTFYQSHLQTGSWRWPTRQISGCSRSSGILRNQNSGRSLVGQPVCVNSGNLNGTGAPFESLKSSTISC